jgi:hypothetical protein
MKSYKPFYICIITEILLWLLFRQTQWLWFKQEILFWNHIIEWILIAIIRPIIWLIRNSKEKNTKYLKIGLIIVEIYLFLLIFIQDWSNFNMREFFILYICVLWIIKETIYKRPKKRQTNSYIIFYTTVVIIILWIWFLMWYREPLNMNKILDQQNYIFTTNFNNSINKNYNSITLTNNYFTEYISNNSWKVSYDLIKNMNYTLDFLSDTIDKNNYIIIQDQLWNILRIFPQTSFSFSTSNYQIQYIDTKKNIDYYSINESFPQELETYKINYNESVKENILKTLPNMLRNNPKLQNISIKYTKFLWTIFPFRYKKNKEILNDYIPYFSDKENEDYKSIKNKYSILKDNWTIWIENINWFKKYKLF